MADGDGANDRPGDREQDPYVSRLRPDPSAPPPDVLELNGLLGDSDRPGYRRLYLTATFEYYAEFRTDAVLDIALVPPEHPPFLGRQSSRVTVRRDVPVDYTFSGTSRPDSDFDLHVRFGRSPGARAPGDRPINLTNWECHITDVACGPTIITCTCNWCTGFTCVNCTEF